MTSRWNSRVASILIVLVGAAVLSVPAYLKAPPADALKFGTKGLSVTVKLNRHETKRLADSSNFAFTIARQIPVPHVRLIAVAMAAQAIFAQSAYLAERCVRFSISPKLTHPYVSIKPGWYKGGYCRRR